MTAMPVIASTYSSCQRPASVSGIRSPVPLRTTRRGARACASSACGCSPGEAPCRTPAPFDARDLDRREARPAQLEIGRAERHLGRGNDQRRRRSHQQVERCTDLGRIQHSAPGAALDASVRDDAGALLGRGGGIQLEAGAARRSASDQRSAGNRHLWPGGMGVSRQFNAQGKRLARRLSAGKRSLHMRDPMAAGQGEILCICRSRSGAARRALP